MFIKCQFISAQAQKWSFIVLCCKIIVLVLLENADGRTESLINKAEHWK